MDLAYRYRRLVAAKFYMDTHWDKKIDIQDISNVSFFSKFHFLRLFKKSFGMSPYQYLVSRRIEESKRLLEEGRNVASVSQLVGFESFASFSLCFKRMTGNSPGRYQSRMLQQAADQKDHPLRFIPMCFLPFDLPENSTTAVS